MNERTRFVWALNVIFVMFSAAIACFFPGCGGGSGSPYPVDPQVAHETLDSVLSSWQNGDTPEMWRERTPEVVVQDIAWKAGEKLQDYEIQGAGKPVDANLVCDVKLTLQNSDGDLHEELVTYLVGTSPVLTVFRQVQP